MGEKSGIEWTDATWNPVTGCDRISPGCAYCYAKTLHDMRHKAFRAGKFVPIQYATPFEVVKTHDSRLDLPLRWKKPRRIFVNSMSDLFHEDVPDEFIVRVFETMAWARRHTFQVLTKRAERMRDLLPRFAHQHTALDGSGWPLPNVWLGVSVENQRFADERIPLLLQTPAAVRFISAEPLLGPVDLADLRGNTFDALTGCGDRERLTEWEDTPRLDWVIVGGESGKGARPFDLAWARSIVQQCQVAGVPVFVKQLGAFPSVANEQVPGWADLVNADGLFSGSAPQASGRGKHGDPADWPADLRVRQFPEFTRGI